MSAKNLPLRDIHLDQAPPWWPPAPGWWMLLAALLVIGAALLGRWWWQRERLRRLHALFDRTVPEDAQAPMQIAAMSEILRRAARRVHADADRLDDAQWRGLLQSGSPDAALDAQAIDLLMQGGYQRSADPRATAELRVQARRRFVDWMMHRGRR